MVAGTGDNRLCRDLNILYLTCADFGVHPSKHCENCYWFGRKAAGLEPPDPEHLPIYRPTLPTKKHLRAQKHAHVVGFFCCSMVEFTLQSMDHDYQGTVEVWADVAKRVRRIKRRGA